MRIISGTARGRRLFSPGSHDKGQTIRPTADRARESLFNIIGSSNISGAKVLDLFAGTGALGLEALSRGAELAVFVDKTHLALSLIKKNISICGFSASLVLKRDLQKGLFFLNREVSLFHDKIKTSSDFHIKEWTGIFDLIFLDPPYRKKLCEWMVGDILENDLVGPGSIVLCEDSSSEKMPEEIGSLKLFDQRNYGDTGFWLYEMADAL